MSNDLDINELKVPATALSRQATETICGALPGKGALLVPNAVVHAERAARALYVYILDTMRQGLWEGMCGG